MSDIQELWDQDAEWLYARAATINKRPTADDEDVFCSRVAELRKEMSLDHDARRQAFFELY